MITLRSTIAQIVLWQCHPAHTLLLSLAQQLSGFKTTMPLHNRIDPHGQLHAHPAKQSTLMGNRGRLHNADKTIVRQWQLKAWITCNLSFKGIKREVFGNSYSELFFLDEATAFAAGHRPCGTCARAKYQQFKQAWCEANHAGQTLTVAEWDKKLHAERLDDAQQKYHWQAPISQLPVGSMFQYQDQCLVIAPDRRLLIWQFEGYKQTLSLPDKTIVDVLTPPSIVKAFQHGYIPTLHPSADQLSLLQIAQLEHF